MELNGIQDYSNAAFNWTGPQRQESAPAQPTPPSASSTLAVSSLSAEAEDISSLSATSPSSVSLQPSYQLAATFTPSSAGEAQQASAVGASGKYDASVVSPQGASAHGATVEIAEYNLSLKLEAIV